MTTQPERVRWAMPRDMSGFSTLEAAMLSAINAAGLPEPVAEYRFVPPCCGHPKRKHRYGECFDCFEPWLNKTTNGAVNGKPMSVGISIRYYGPRACHDYDAGRRWRFDFAWPALMIAVECEGGTFSGGRHTTGAGFEKDAEKYSTATAMGWRVMRFTQRQIASGAALELLERAMGSCAEQAAQG